MGCLLKSRIPKGFRLKAQGCDEGATLGLSRRSSTTLKGLRRIPSVRQWMEHLFRFCIVILVGLLGAGPAFGKSKEPLTLIVMDPLAKELACACVKGFGQRDYRKLAARLDKALGQSVPIDFSDDLAETLAAGSGRNTISSQVIVVGDRSMVMDGAKKAGLKCHPVCELTDSDGNTTLSASFIVRSDDPAKELKDL